MVLCSPFGVVVVSVVKVTWPMIRPRHPTGGFVPPHSAALAGHPHANYHICRNTQRWWLGFARPSAYSTHFVSTRRWKPVRPCVARKSNSAKLFQVISVRTVRARRVARVAGGGMEFRETHLPENPLDWRIKDAVHLTTVPLITAGSPVGEGCG